MKFKVGDRVRFIKSIWSHSCRVKVGEVYKIKNVDKGSEIPYQTETNFEWFKEEELELVYTYKDLKKSPIGTKITFENGTVLVKDEEDYFENVSKSRDIANLYNLKDNYSSLGKIIKIEEPEYKTVYESKVEILDEVEKRYLKGVIRPFRDKVTYIRKFVYSTGDAKIDIVVENWYICLPTFPKNQMYKNMEDDKEYTLEELGL